MAQCQTKEILDPGNIPVKYASESIAHFTGSANVSLVLYTAFLFIYSRLSPFASEHNCYHNVQKICLNYRFTLFACQEKLWLISFWLYTRDDCCDANKLQTCQYKAGAVSIETAGANKPAAIAS